MPEIFKNAADIQRMFNRHDYTMRRKILIKAGKEGAEEFRQRMEDTAPRRTNELAENQVVKLVGGESNAAVAVFRIGPARSVFWGLFQEKGTAFHAPQPFVEPALEDAAQPALNATIDASRKELTRLGG